MATAQIAKAPQVNGKQTVPPSQTLYCTNLSDKLQKPDLRRALYALFSTYGPVLDVVALKTPKMRGQAHIVFRDVQTSTQAMRALQEFEFFGKKMKITYGKGKSDIIARLDGTAKMPEVKGDSGASTELQKSIFNAPSMITSGQPAQALPPVPPAPAAETPQGTKRQREDESDEEGAPMEEDDDEGEAMMEESDED